MNNSAVISHFNNQANACANMNSPFTAKLCTLLVDILDSNTLTGERINNWPGNAAADALALRLCGALHAIVIENPNDELAAIYPDGDHPQYSSIVSAAIGTHDKQLSKWLDLPPQTNETGRAAALLPGLLEISRLSQMPIHLCEIGASAGLNMQLDQFHYTYDHIELGDPASPVKLEPIVKGKLPNLSGNLNITSRIGCDISPLNILDPQEQLRLRAYIWPDQPYRTKRIEGAINLAVKSPPKLVKQDAAKFVEQQLSGRVPNTAFVVMHSVVWQYLPPETQQQIEQSLHHHGESTTSPIYWLRLEGFGGKEPAASLMLDSWPNHKQIKLANSCFHSSWIDFV